MADCHEQKYKGWIQTVALCLGKGIPQSLRLGLKQQLAVHGILSAGVLGLLLYPVSIAVVGSAAVAALAGHWPVGPYAWALLALNLTNLSPSWPPQRFRLRGVSGSPAPRT
jgi:hypothetical protein